MNNRPIVVHIIYRLSIGGLETVLTDFINNCDENRFKNIIICLTDSTDFKKRLIQEIPIYELHKKDGKDLNIFFILLRMLRRIKPAIVHTYNIGTLEYQLAALLAGVKGRVHAEHGRDFSDPDGTNWKYNLLRKLFKRIVTNWITVSHDLQNWLSSVLGISSKKIHLIYNGVDTKRFSPENIPPPDLTDFINSNTRSTTVIGTVGRLDPVKNHALLIESFNQIIQQYGEKNEIRLIIIGDGPLLSPLKQLAIEKKLSELIWFPGARNDIPSLLAAFDLFVLPSIAEGTPMTILEAMATELPVVATDVGGLAEIVSQGRTGTLVPSNNVQALSQAIELYITNNKLGNEHGKQGRESIVNNFSIEKMTQQYCSLYDTVLG